MTSRLPQFSERSTIVLDIGSRYTKVGFAGDLHPRFIIPSRYQSADPTQPDSQQPVGLFDPTKTEEENELALKRFIHHLYYNYLMVVPKERRVVIVESVLRPTAEREQLARLLFDTYSVPSVLFAPAHLLATMPFKTQSALVIDVGHRETLVLPISEGVPMLNSWEASPSGGRTVQTNLRRLLLEHATLTSARADVDAKQYINDLDDDTVEDILVRCCFVTTADRALAYRVDGKHAHPAPNIEYPLADGNKLVLPGFIRETAYEPLFHSSDDDRKTVPHLVLDSIHHCPIDLRRPMSERLLLIGGLPMVNGFIARLKNELNGLLAGSYAERLPMRAVKFFLLRQPNVFNYMAWLGGSVFGATEILAYRSLSREDWLKTHHVQDWTDKVFDGYALEIGQEVGVVEKKG